MTKHYYPTTEEINEYLAEEYPFSDIEKKAKELNEWIKDGYKWLIETGMPPITGGMEDLYNTFQSSMDDRSDFDKMEGAEYDDA